MLGVMLHECYKGWVSCYTSVTKVGCHVTRVLHMLGVILHECYTCWVSYYMSVTHVGCHVTLVLHMLGVMLQLCLDPDTTNRTCCMTEVILDSNNPLFDEKFSL